MSAGDRVRGSVTCPQCGSLVPVGDRKCDNCGARQKDFAPAPASYSRVPAAAPVSLDGPVSSARPVPSGPPPASAAMLQKGAAPGAIPARSAAARRALLFAALPVGMNVLGSVLLIVIVTTGLSDIEGWGSAVLGLLVVGILLVTGLSTLVFFVLAVVFGILGLRETVVRAPDGRPAVPGRGRAIAALLIVGAHLGVWILIGIASAATP